MGRFVAEIEQDMSARELAEWQAFYALEPFGPERDNWHHAMQAHLLANAHRAPNSRPAQLSDFMWKTPEERQRDKDAQTLTWFEEHAN